ncbi:MAG TPA: glycosyltransferase family 87 protein [Vicinamibacteria bacterium]|nr:glycosyltransferase family 87 protein [Vicinamibacteria bacterium]
MHEQRPPAFEPWEVVPAVLAVGGVLLWALPAFANDRPLDLGLALKGGEEAWQTGHPERLRTWMSTPFLAVLMALASRVFSIGTAMRLMTALNLVATLGLAAAVWRGLRGRAPRLWWWITLLAALLYAPLISTVFFKQLNVWALALAVAGFAAVRAGRPVEAGALVALSVCLKPIVILLPLALLARRDTRASGLWAAACSLVLVAVAQVFLALRAGDAASLSPLPALAGFAAKTEPWICHPENFSPQGLLCRLTGPEALAFQRALVLAGVSLLALLAHDVTRHRPGASWEVFAFVCLLSPMVSPVSWTHYQLFLAPMLLLLAHRFVEARASLAQWAGLLSAFVLSDLVLRPFDSVPGVILGALAGRWEERRELLRFMAASQFAQYVLFLTAFGWFSRFAAPPPTGGPA